MNIQTLRVSSPALWYELIQRQVSLTFAAFLTFGSGLGGAGFCEQSGGNELRNSYT